MHVLFGGTVGAEGLGTLAAGIAIDIKDAVDPLKPYAAPRLKLMSCTRNFWQRT